MPAQYSAKYGALACLWAVATADGPTTATEIGERLGCDRDTVSGQLTNLAYSGYLVRRLRERRSDGNRGRYPYEYALAPPDDDFGPPPRIDSE